MEYIYIYAKNEPPKGWNSGHTSRDMVIFWRKQLFDDSPKVLGTIVPVAKELPKFLENRKGVVITIGFCLA